MNELNLKTTWKRRKKETLVEYIQKYYDECQKLREDSMLKDAYIDDLMKQNEFKGNANVVLFMFIIVITTIAIFIS